MSSVRVTVRICCEFESLQGFIFLFLSTLPAQLHPFTSQKLVLRAFV